MATGTVTPAMRKKAEALADLVPTFSTGRSKRNGVHFVIVPGTQPGTAHWSNGLGCTCEGFRRRGTCTHSLAVSLAHQRVETAQRPVLPPAKSAQQIYQEAGPFGPCVGKGCTSPAQGKSRRCGPCLDALVATLGA